MKTYSVYVSTSSVVNTPIKVNGISQVKWNVNWKEIFGNRTGECRVRTRMLSSSGTLSWAANTGSLRVSLQSTSSNCSNGLNLGCLRPQSDYTGSNVTYLDVDTTMSSGVTIIIPNTNNDFYVSLYDKDEKLMTTNAPTSYQLWLFFDCDDEDPNVGDGSIYNPR